MFLPLVSPEMWLSPSADGRERVVLPVWWPRLSRAVSLPVLRTSASWVPQVARFLPLCGDSTVTWCYGSSAMRRQRFMQILARAAPFIDSLAYLLLLAAVIIWFYLAPTSSPNDRLVLRWLLFIVLAVVVAAATAARIADTSLRSEAKTALNDSRGKVPRLLFHLSAGLLAIFLLYLMVHRLGVVESP